MDGLRNGMEVTAHIGRYIKLGTGGCWEPLCLEDGTLRLGFYEVPHEFGATGNKDAIKHIYAHLPSAVASDHARQVLQFYDTSAEVIWITFANGFLWWCKAEPDIEYFGGESVRFPDGSRLRRAVNGWSNQSVHGKLLRVGELRGDLTKTAAYRKTICDLKPDLLAYLLRKINDEELPEVRAAQQAIDGLQVALGSLIQMLNAQDFELLVELIFSQSGWQRISSVGGTTKTTDIELRLPITGELAMVQVKSETNQKEFNDYIAAFERRGIQRLFYVYHTAKGRMALNGADPRITLIGPEQLAPMVIRAGLIDWVMEKAG